MSPKKFAFFSGLVWLVVGIVSLIPSMVGSANGLPPLYIDNSYGMFMNFLPLNLVSKLLMIGFGVVGIYSSRALGRELPYSIAFARGAFAILGSLAILSLIPSTNTLFGYMPLFGANSWMAGVLSLVSAYFGYALTAQVPADRTGVHPNRESLAH